MNTYGYIYAPTGTPDYHAQHFAVLSFVSNNRLGQVNFIHEAPDRLHGAKSILTGMLSTLQREDALIVTDFSKLGSSTLEVLDALSTLSQRGVRLYAVASGYRLDSNADALVVATACALVAQIERELHVHPEPVPEPDPALIQMQRDDADLQTPARRTRKSKLDGRRSEIEALLSTGISLSEAARRLGVSRPTLTDWVDSRNLSVQNPPTST